MIKDIIKTLFISVIMIVFGVAISIYGNEVVNDYIKKNDNLIEVTATVIDYVYPYDEEDGAYIVYSYVVDGINYNVESGSLSTNLPAIGSSKTIKYNPSDPKEVVLNNDSNYVVLFVGAGFVLAGVFGLFRCIVMSGSAAKKSKKVSENTNIEA
jgi:hypothetical protein